MKSVARKIVRYGAQIQSWFECACARVLINQPHIIISSPEVLRIFSLFGTSVVKRWLHKDLINKKLQSTMMPGAAVFLGD